MSKDKAFISFSGYNPDNPEVSLVVCDYMEDELKSVSFPAHLLPKIVSDAKRAMRVVGISETKNDTVIDVPEFTGKVKANSWRGELSVRVKDKDGAWYNLRFSPEAYILFCNAVKSGADSIEFVPRVKGGKRDE